MRRIWWYSDCRCHSNLNANVANGANLTNKIYSRYSFIRGIRVKTGLVSKMNRFSHQFCLPHIWGKTRKLPKSHNFSRLSTKRTFKIAKFNNHNLCFVGISLRRFTCYGDIPKILGSLGVAVIKSFWTRNSRKTRELFKLSP